MGHHDHHLAAHQKMTTPICCGIITVSDTRTPETDSSGATIRTMIEQAGHTVLCYEIVKDEPSNIKTLIEAFQSTGCQIIITNGGTGLSKRDGTVDSIEQLLEKQIPGFGEIFRMLSYLQIGSSAMFSRAIAGTYKQTMIYCLPGSTNAVHLAMEKLIIPELAHVVWELTRHAEQ